MELCKNKILRRLYIATVRTKSLAKLEFLPSKKTKLKTTLLRILYFDFSHSNQAILHVTHVPRTTAEVGEEGGRGGGGGCSMGVIKS